MPGSPCSTSPRLSVAWIAPTLDRTRSTHLPGTRRADEQTSRTGCSATGTSARPGFHTGASEPGRTRGSLPTVNGEEHVMDFRPFTISVPEEHLVDLRRRIAATQWPDREDMH